MVMTLFTVYKTVNLINGKFYFGVHKTSEPNDEYLGSGTYIKRAVAKYGVQKFRKEVLFIYLDAESAFAKEDELIQCWRGRDPLCMNLRKGGSGGFDYINKQGLVDFRSRGKKANEAFKARMSKDADLRQSYRDRRLAFIKKYAGTPEGQKAFKKDKLKLPKYGLDVSTLWTLD